METTSVQEKAAKGISIHSGDRHLRGAIGVVLGVALWASFIVGGLLTAFLLGWVVLWVVLLGSGLSAGGAAPVLVQPRSRCLR